MVRVIAGSAKGLRLKTIDSEDTKPTLDRVKEAMFSILLPWIPNAVFVDVFAGNGSLGIEALSRGCHSVYFNDLSRQCCKIIKDNLNFTKFQDKAFVYNLYYTKFIQKLSRMDIRADVILLDPPYGSEMITECIKALSSYNICNDGGIILAEHAKTDILEEVIGDFVKFKTRDYGNVTLTLYERRV